MMGGVSGCNADMATIDELSQMLNEELVKENASAAQVSEFEKCQEQLVMGMNVWMSYKMSDETFTHVKFYHDTLGTGEYELECIWNIQEADAAFQYGCD